MLAVEDGQPVLAQALVDAAFGGAWSELATRSFQPVDALGGKGSTPPESPNLTQPTRGEGMESQPSGNSAPNPNVASKGRASVSATHLTAKTEQTEETVTCRICQENLPGTAFSKGKLKKLKKAKAKGTLDKLAAQVILQDALDSL